MEEKEADSPPALVHKSKGGHWEDGNESVGK